MSQVRNIKTVSGSLKVKNKILEEIKNMTTLLEVTQVLQRIVRTAALLPEDVDILQTAALLQREKLNKERKRI